MIASAIGKAVIEHFIQKGIFIDMVDQWPNISDIFIQINWASATKKKMANPTMIIF